MKDFKPIADHLFVTQYLNGANLDEDDFDYYFGNEREEDIFGDEAIPLENIHPDTY